MNEEREIELTLIDPPQRVARMEIDPERVASLTSSIREQGMHQAILVRPKGDRFEIVFGHRRYLAHQRLGLVRIRCKVRELSDSEAELVRGDENISRHDLSPIEEGKQFYELVEVHGMSVGTVAERYGLSRNTVTKRLHLLRMPELLQVHVHKGGLSAGAALVLAEISDETALEYYTAYAVENGVSQAVCRSWVQEWRTSVRRREGGDGPGGVPEPVFETPPVYLPCDFCRGPEDLRNMRRFSACLKCQEKLRAFMRGSGGEGG